PDTQGLPNFASRSGADYVAGTPDDVAAARQELAASLGQQGVLQVDPNTGTPRVVARLDGFLSGPSSAPAASVALGYVRAHLAAFGLTTTDLATLHLTRDYMD